MNTEDLRNLLAAAQTMLAKQHIYSFYRGRLYEDTKAGQSSFEVSAKFRDECQQARDEFKSLLEQYVESNSETV